MTRLLAPVIDTAANKAREGDQTTARQDVSVAEVLDVQVMPSGEVITLLPTPVLDTAANNDSSGDQATPSQSLSAADVLVVHSSFEFHNLTIPSTEPIA